MKSVKKNVNVQNKLANQENVNKVHKDLKWRQVQANNQL